MISDEQFSDFYKVLDEKEKILTQTQQILDFESMILNRLQRSTFKREKNTENLQQQQKRNQFHCYFCKECLQDFERLNSHYLAAHNTKVLYYGPTKFSCRICFKEYKGVENLILHERNTKHTKEFILYQTA
ncbi:hypothetical protein pb186bvf_011685 [Paramecium bursaria]